MPKTHFSRSGSNVWVDSFYRPPFTTGNVFFAGSTVTGATDSTSYGRSPEAPFATLNYAISQCTADNGDTVLLCPGHVETLIAAGTCSVTVAGVSVVGLGTGRQRAKVNYTTAAAASFNVAAARFSIENVYFTPIGFDAVTAAVNISVADVTIKNCEFELANATNQATLGILTTASADRLMIDGCHFHGTTDAGTATAIRVVGGTDAKITNNVILGAFTTTLGGIQNVTTAAVNMNIQANVIANLTASSSVCITLVSTTTGMVTNNRLSVLTGTAPIVGAALNGVGGNYYAAAAGVTAGTLI